MRGEAIRSCAASATVTVQDPISEIASHGRLVFLDSLRQIHDTSYAFVVLERGSHDTASLLFLSQTLSAARHEKGAGSEM